MLFKREPEPEAEKKVLSRNQQRKQARYQQVLRVVCAACKSPKGQYIKAGNRFICETPGCKWQRKPIT